MVRKVHAPTNGGPHCAMVREFSRGLECAMSAADFWALRSDTGFDDFFAKIDKQVFKLIQNDLQHDEKGRPFINRQLKLTLLENPVPASMRKMFGVSDEFAFKVKCAFHTELYDEAHPFTYQTFFPVLTDKIEVTGLQWCVPLTESTCTLCAAIRVRVAIPGIGGTVEKAVEKSMRAAYKELPRRSLEYVAYRDSLRQRVAPSAGPSAGPPGVTAGAAGVLACGAFGIRLGTLDGARSPLRHLPPARRHVSQSTSPSCAILWTARSPQDRGRG